MRDFSNNFTNDQVRMWCKFSQMRSDNRRIERFNAREDRREMLRDISWLITLVGSCYIIWVGLAAING